MKYRAWVSVLSLTGVMALALVQQNAVKSDTCLIPSSISDLQANVEISSDSVVNTNSVELSAPNCNETNNVASTSWAAWFSGKSVSFQFHFLDLLELLHDESESEHFRHSPQ